MIFNEGIVRLGDPEPCWSLISVQTTPTSLDFHHEILIKIILLLDGVFNENVVTFDFISNVVHDSHVVSSMQSERSIETFVDCIAFGI
jgi:hypothetical protein